MAKKKNQKKKQKRFFKKEAIMGMSGRCVHVCLWPLEVIFLNF